MHPAKEDPSYRDKCAPLAIDLRPHLAPWVFLWGMGLGFRPLTPRAQLSAGELCISEKLIAATP